VNPAPADRVLVGCEPAGQAAVRVRVVNVSGQDVHIFDSPRMPYLIREQGGTLLVLYGVNPPDPELDYFGIEIPLTRPLAAGEVVEHEVSLGSSTLHDHYEADREPTELHGTVTVLCEVGWLERPIAAEERDRWSITTLLEEQRLAHAEAAQVEFD
jgi:hypothetical protein